MTHLQALVMLLACLVLCACGNKGDLFLVPSEATEADLENVEEVLDELEGNPDEQPSADDAESEEGADVDETMIDESGTDDSTTETPSEDEDNNDDDDRRNNKKTP